MTTTASAADNEFERFEVSDGWTYEDGYCCLKDNNLTVYKTIERLGASRSFRVQDIEWVATGHDLQLGHWAYKGWGLGLSPILWAMDMKRSPTLSLKIQAHKAIVIKPRNAWLRVGFTCDRPDLLFEALENICPGLTKSQRFK